MLAVDFMTAVSLGSIGVIGVIALLLAFANMAHASNHEAVAVKLEAVADKLETAHEALDVVGQVGALVAAGKSLPEAMAIVGPSDEAKDLIHRLKVLAHLACFLIFATLTLGGCSAEQLAREEAAAHIALTKLEQGVDWLNANPATVNALLDDAAGRSSDPGFQKALAKARAAVAAGDLQTAQRFLQVGAAITAPGTQ